MNTNLILIVCTAIFYHQCNAQSCSRQQSCATSACCSQWGNCGYGPDFCGAGCLRDCNATSECGQFAPPGERNCPLNVCCSQYGFCGTTSEFCTTSCQNGCSRPSMPQRGGGNGNIVAGYYESWASTRPCDAWTPSNINPRTYTHLLYAFARVSGSVMASPTSTEASDMLAFTALKNQNPDLKCLVSVGGWAFNDPGPTQSEFHNIAASSSSRATFISSVQNFLGTYGFDGIDIDWEYPVAEERGGHPEDKQNYLLLVQEMRTTFGSSKLITIAAPASYWYLRHFLIGQMSTHLDFINLMTYDFNGVWNVNNVLGTKLRSHTDIRLLIDALDLCARDSVSAGKIVLGIGYYGRSYTLASTSCTTIETCDFSGPGNPGPCTNAAGVLSWKEIQDIATANHLTPILDTPSQSKILTWSNQWVSYDDDETHEYRRNFATSNGLGGFMVWSIDQGSASSQTEPINMDEMKWYQCIQHPEHCCNRTNVFCLPNCNDGCYFQQVLADTQYSTTSKADYIFTTWMSQLSDNLRLTEMSIPGTHDTATYDTNVFAQCQSMTIADQLDAGIRVIDARCRHINDVFAMHHDRVYLHLAFGDVLTTLSDFLRNNPGEMIIMRVKKEYTEEGNSRTFQETLDSYLQDPKWSNFFDTSSQLDTLGNHRGKILIMNDHNCNFGQYGYCWGSAQIQDQYTLPFPAPFGETYAMWKMDHVKTQLEASNNDNDNLYINFLSAQLVPLVNPVDLATTTITNPLVSATGGVNELASKLLNANPTSYKKTGLVLMDFPGSYLIYQILIRN